MDRRTFITAAGASTVAAGLPRLSIAETIIGGGTLRTVSDGHLVLPQSFVLGDFPEAEARTIIEAAGYEVAGLNSPCNLALWENGENRVLFDVGAGPDFMPSAGKIMDSLDALGLSPDDITHVVFTHAHPDHLWGAVDDFDEPLFYNAIHMMGADEIAYWTAPETIDAIAPERQSFVAGARRRLDLLGAGIAPIGGGDEILPGITVIDTPGHTPGHLGFRIASGDGSALIVGDAIGNGHLALARPEWPSPADNDPALGMTTRMSLLEELASSNETLVGFHLPDGGIGTVAKDDAGYSFTSA